MEIVVSSVTNDEEQFEMLRFRRQIFEQELGITVNSLDGLPPEKAHHLLARAGPAGEVIAALSVVDTTDDRQLHERYGMNFPSQVRVARYTQLAVVKPYRGLGITLMLILEANRRFLAGQFKYTWLLYKADRAAVSSFCRLLAFSPGDQPFETEYGYSRVLIRNESALNAPRSLYQAEQYLQGLFRSLSLSIRSDEDPCELALPSVLDQNTRATLVG
jgi:hypothetical protein